MRLIAPPQNDGGEWLDFTFEDEHGHTYSVSLHIETHTWHGQMHWNCVDGCNHPKHRNMPSEMLDELKLIAMPFV